MKKRLKFVSNSSSTSFTCEVCNHTEEFHDSEDKQDYGFYICINEHHLCNTCIGVEHIETTYNDYLGQCIKEKLCPICRFEIISDCDLKKYLKVRYKTEEDEVLNHIKSINKRRKRIYIRDYINYVLAKNTVLELDIITTIKSTFKDYKSFHRFLWEDTKQ